MERIGAIVVAAGSSTRAGGRTLKQFAVLDSEPMFVMAVRAVADHADEIVVVAPPDALGEARRLLGEAGWPADGGPSEVTVVVVPGGARRQDSVLRGLEALSADAEVVLIHDAARPFASSSLVKRVLDAAREHGAAVPAVAVPDTVKRVEDGLVVATLDRDVLALAQTPQAFRRRVIDDAYAALEGAPVTDDAQAVELAGNVVAVVAGDAGNIKVTCARDLETARLRAAAAALLPAGARVGTGTDFHRLRPGRKLVLCGIEIPFEKGLDGWSDADVATHAVMDALLGAVAAGDIGMHFPPGDPELEGISSMELLDRVVETIRSKGYCVANVDVTIVAEEPRLASHVMRMRESLASAVCVDVDRVSVKATTTEGSGPEGAGEAMSAHAIVAVTERTSP